VDEENARIMGISALSRPGYEAEIQEMIADGETTPEQAAVRLLQVMKTRGDYFQGAKNGSY